VHLNHIHGDIAKADEWGRLIRNPYKRVKDVRSGVEICVVLGLAHAGGSRHLPTLSSLDKCSFSLVCGVVVL
jgi:hypothetical protein